MNNTMITDWLDQHGDPDINKKVEDNLNRIHDIMTGKFIAKKLGDKFFIYSGDIQIGEASKEAVWLKEGDEFLRDDLLANGVGLMNLSIVILIGVLGININLK